LVVLRPILGLRSMLVYVVTIMVCAVLAGYALDEAYRVAGVAPRALTRAGIAEGPGVFSHMAAVILTFLIGWGIWIRLGRPGARRWRAAKENGSN